MYQWGMLKSVCWSVRSSSVSSSVPNPPGTATKPCDSFTSMSLRVKKYFIETCLGSSWITSLARVSKGSRMLTPIEASWPAPSMAACMIPGPAPVTTIQPRRASCSATSWVWA